MNSSIKQTTLYNEHLNSNAKIVEFAGFMMPVNYDKGIQQEYNAVRNCVGIFDVSHMGEIFIYGDESENFLQFMTVNDITKMSVGDAQYNIICNNNGGIKDDIIIYRLEDKYILIVNASNVEKIFNWLLLNNNFECKIENKSDEFSLIAVQGPKSRALLSETFDMELGLKFYKHETINYKQNNLLLSRTGYTGELGYEILCKHHDAIKLWKKLINLGASPCGLAVRDVLRMEMRYCLYGNDINESTSPIEAGLNWVVDFKNKFNCSEILLNQKNDGSKLALVAFKMIDRCIPRNGHGIYCYDNKIGEVTSGTYSIGLKSGIGLGYVCSKHSISGTKINLKIRNKINNGEIIKPPFITKFSLHD